MRTFSAVSHNNSHINNNKLGLTNGKRHKEVANNNPNNNDDNDNNDTQAAVEQAVKAAEYHGILMALRLRDRQPYRAD